MRHVAEDLHVGFYGAGHELVRIVRVEYNKERDVYDIDYVWVKGSDRTVDEVVHAHLAPLSRWRLPEIPFIIEEWL